MPQNARAPWLADAKQRSTVLQWLMFQMGGIGPMQGQANVFVRYFPDRIPAVIDRFQNEVKRLYGVMNARLADVAYLVGAYSIADMATFPWVAQLDWSGIDLAPFLNLARWLGDVGVRPAVIRGMAIPEPPRPPTKLSKADRLQ